MQRHHVLIPFLAPLLVLPVQACGSDDDGVSIEGAWARPSATGQTTGAVYFRITSDVEDRLLAVSVPASVAATAEVHEVVMADMSDDMEMSDDMDMSDEMDTSDEMDMSGDMQMTMQELTDGLPLPAGDTVTLEPGGYHIMLLDITEPLEVGDEVEVTLDFETADDLTLTVEVAESAP
ncbi:MAG: hypothetical protein RLZZ01_2160 [Actinomycetota bacterium]